MQRVNCNRVDIELDLNFKFKTRNLKSFEFSFFNSILTRNKNQIIRIRLIKLIYIIKNKFIFNFYIRIQFKIFSIQIIKIIIKILK